MKKNNCTSFLQGFSRFVQWLVGGLFLFLGAVVLLNGLLLPGQYSVVTHFAMAMVLLGTTALALLYLNGGILYRGMSPRLSQTFSSKRTSWAIFGMLLILCFGIRLAWVLAFQVQPQVDYYTMYHAADCLTEQFDISGIQEDLPRYIALFPHIFGYSSFLSLIFFAFGTSPMVAAITNVVLSTISMAFLYYIGWKLSGRLLAVLTSLIWCFTPSQIIFNMQVLSEPYYTTLLLAGAALLLFLRGKLSDWEWWKLGLGGAILGAILALANSARPVSTILIIAMAIVLFVMEPLAKNALVGKKAVILVCLCVVYFFGNTVNARLFENRIGEAPASMPGFNILVGFNPETTGKWSAEDSELLSQYSDTEDLSAREVQGIMLDTALDRITSGDVNIPKLFYEKLQVLWDSDDAAVVYGREGIPHANGFSALSNGYYYLTWILAMFGLWRLLRKGGSVLFYLFPLYLVGLTMAHMLVEVALRYHYSGIPCLVLLAALGLQELGKLSLDRTALLKKGSPRTEKRNA
ncbi:MAG: hypothetical protein ACOYJZ_03400 [Acutalibacter sp.]|jgi:hypothetical protein